MPFYDLSKIKRAALAAQIHREIQNDFSKGETENVLVYFSDEDTYIRKAGYLAVGKIYKSDKNLRAKILNPLKSLLGHPNEKVRQTVVNAAGEIGMADFEIVQHFFDTALFDEHHSVRNAVIGSVKKMGQKNPQPVLAWAQTYLHHQEKEIRREICHGIELRGRTHPQDILPLLEQLQWDETKRVRDTLIHVLGQIAYKKGCLKTVISALNQWENQDLVKDAIDEIIDVHHRYRSFAILTQREAIDFIEKYYNPITTKGNN